MRYEIRNMTMPARVQEAMQMQVEAERKKVKNPFFCFFQRSFF